MPRIRRTRPAAVLVLALLLMGAIIGSGIALSTVIGDSNHQTTALNNFIAASLGADSGLERSLGIIKQGRAASSLSTTIAAASLSSTTIGTTQTTATVQQSGSGDSLYIPKLAPGQSVSVDIINTLNTLDPVLSGVTPDTLSITFEAASQAAYDARTSTYSTKTALDISWIALDSTGNPLYSGRKTDLLGSAAWRSTPSGVCIPVSNGSYGSCPNTVQLNNNLRDQSGSPATNLNNIKGYRIRFTAPDAPAGVSSELFANYKISVTSSCSAGATNCVANFPSRLSISSTGKVGSSQSQKSASVLWQPVASPVFNYVLFTEGDIVPE